MNLSTQPKQESQSLQHEAHLEIQRDTLVVPEDSASTRPVTVIQEEDSPYTSQLFFERSHFAPPPPISNDSLSYPSPTDKHNLSRHLLMIMFVGLISLVVVILSSLLLISIHSNSGMGEASRHSIQHPADLPASTYPPNSTYPPISTNPPMSAPIFGKPTLTPWPTYTPFPTYTPYPTFTPRPTQSVQPTYTPYPTFTPILSPTNTPILPTNTPELPPVTPVSSADTPTPTP
jgi:hypothetical protein